MIFPARIRSMRTEHDSAAIDCVTRTASTVGDRLAVSWRLLLVVDKFRNARLRRASGAIIPGALSILKGTVPGLVRGPTYFRRELRDLTLQRRLRLRVPNDDGWPRAIRFIDSIINCKCDGAALRTSRPYRVTLANHLPKRGHVDMRP